MNAIQQVVKTRMHALAQFHLFALAIGGVVMLVGSLVVFVTMMGSVNERTREIGIFRALGFRRSHVIRLILIEATVVSFFSGVLGYLSGVLATWLALPLLSDAAPVWSWNPTLAFGAVTMAILIVTTMLAIPMLIRYVFLYSYRWSLCLQLLHLSHLLPFFHFFSV